MSLTVLVPTAFRRGKGEETELFPRRTEKILSSSSSEGDAGISHDRLGLGLESRARPSTSGRLVGGPPLHLTPRVEDSHVRLKGSLNTPPVGYLLGG